MQVKAKLNNLKISPRKVRLVIDVIRGLKVEDAITQLNFVNKAAKFPVLKLLNSAIANAENNYELKKDNLYIKEIAVNQSGVLKRWQPRAHGRATSIRKRMSVIDIVLAEVVPTKKKIKKQTANTDKPVKIDSLDKVKQAVKPKKIEKTDIDKVKAKEHEKEMEKEVLDPRMEAKHRHQQHGDKRSMKGKKGFINKIFNRKSG